MISLPTKFSIFFFYLIGSFLIGVLLSSIIFFYYAKKQVMRLQKEIKSSEKDQIKYMLSALGQKPSEEKINRILSMSKKLEEKKRKSKKINTM
ncbi:YneF family protein [endosymbiont GvMRE of Glomus versiforme]|uniref:YneF family protein n=1 Tax=endosymbiont GvMRE of Glomus versiforme TaxID=2039283 RepID=UPI000EDAC14E|nr:YneF family protein [endosymbiont GvMRE of Glomus versiforme]RHZ35195.1 hypothetical protein GvMRE_IIg486 [endosymbiont GvMRE of Glomus versiforme]